MINTIGSLATNLPPVVTFAFRSICLVIGDQDQRVGTKHAIDLATRLTAASLKKQVPSRGLSDEGKSLKKAIGHCETTEWTVVSY